MHTFVGRHAIVTTSPTSLHDPQQFAVTLYHSVCCVPHVHNVQGSTSPLVLLKLVPAMESIMIDDSTRREARGHKDAKVAADCVRGM